ALEAVVVWPRVPRTPVGEIELGIVGAGHPDRSAAVLPRPRIGPAPRPVAGILGARGRVEPPDLLARLRIVGIDEAANAVLGAGDADDHFVFHHERRGRPAVAATEVLHRRIPLD